MWIVYHDSGPDENILGIFDNFADATAYHEQEWPEYENGVLLSEFPVPWRRTDRVTTISIGH